MRLIDATIRPRRRRHLRAGLARRGAFSLVELMIAIGIMGVGMTMAAALFPAAVKETARTVDNVIGDMICQNGLAVAKAVFTANTSANLPTEINNAALSILADETTTSVLSIGSQHYPHPDRPYNPNNDETTKGYVILGREIDLDSDSSTDEGYQLVIVSYKTVDQYKNRNPLKLVRAQDITCRTPGALPSTTLNVTGGQQFVDIGSPVIIKATGEFATIIAWDGNNTAILDREMTVSAGSPAFVIEQDNTTSSQAMSVLVARTGLRAN